MPRHPRRLGIQDVGIVVDGVILSRGPGSAGKRFPFDFETGVPDHAVDGLFGVAASGQVTVHEEGVRRIEGKDLQMAEMAFPAGSDPDLRPGIDEPEGAENPEAAARRELIEVVDRVALDGDQEVDRDGGDLQRTELVRHVQDVLVRLAHSGDHAAAALQAGSTGRFQGGDPVLVGVGAHDAAGVAAAGVQIVVEPVQAGPFEQARLLEVHQSRREAGPDPHLPVDAADDPGQLGRLLGSRSAPAGHHAVPVDPLFLGLPGLLDDGFLVLRGVLAQRGLRDLGLGAVAAVLGAEAVLDVVDLVDLHFAPEAGHPHVAGGRHQAEDVDGGIGQDLHRVFPGEELSAQGDPGPAFVSILHLPTHGCPDQFTTATGCPASGDPESP